MIQSLSQNPSAGKQTPNARGTFHIQAVTVCLGLLDGKIDLFLLKHFGRQFFSNITLA
jgi:hypothetical protein